MTNINTIPKHPSQTVPSTIETLQGHRGAPEGLGAVALDSLLEPPEKLHEMRLVLTGGYKDEEGFLKRTLNDPTLQTLLTSAREGNVALQMPVDGHMDDERLEDYFAKTGRESSYCVMKQLIRRQLRDAHIFNFEAESDEGKYEAAIQDTDFMQELLTKGVAFQSDQRLISIDEATSERNTENVIKVWQTLKDKDGNVTPFMRVTILPQDRNAVFRLDEAQKPLIQEAFVALPYLRLPTLPQK